MDWRRKDIRIRTKNGWRYIEATVARDLWAVHEPEAGGQHGYALTHVPTGMAVAFGFEMKKDAKLAAEEASAAFDWSVISADPDGRAVNVPPGAADHFQGAVERAGGYLARRRQHL